MSVILEPPAADASPDLIDRLKQAAGPGGWIEDPDALANRLTDWRGLYRGRVRLALQPGSTAAEDGSVLDGLRTLRKDNTGYDLKQLFIGAEGTLGIITAAALKLFPRPRERATALAAIATPAAALTLLARCRAASADAVTSFELMPRQGIDLARTHVPDTADPLPGHAYYLLIELASPAAAPLSPVLEKLLATALEDGLIEDATIAGSTAQAQ